MSRYLVTTTEVYRIDSEDEVEAFIAEAKKANYELKKYTSEYKETKSKGEVLDSWFRVTLTKGFNVEKDPASQVDVKYEVSF